MAHSIEKWERAEALYLAGVPIGAIEAEVGIKKSALYTRANKERWESRRDKEKRKPMDYRSELEKRANEDCLAKTPNGIRVLEEVEARKKLKEIEEWKATAPVEQTRVHEELVLDRLVLERAFASSAMRNQTMIDKAVLTREVEELGMAGIDLLKKHAETTKLNKANVLGSDPIVKIEGKAGDEQAFVFMPPEMDDNASVADAVDVDEDDS